MTIGKMAGSDSMFTGLFARPNARTAILIHM